MIQYLIGFHTNLGKNSFSKEEHKQEKILQWFEENCNEKIVKGGMILLIYFPEIQSNIPFSRDNQW